MEIATAPGAGPATTKCNPFHASETPSNVFGRSSASSVHVTPSGLRTTTPLMPTARYSLPVQITSFNH